MKDKIFSTIPSKEKLELIAGWLEEKQARDGLGLEVRGISSLTDYMLIATGRNIRHVQSLADWLSKKAKEENVEFLGMEGYQSAQWILVDMNDIIVHLFLPETRESFNLEGLWAKAEVAYRQPEDSGDFDDDDDY